MKVLIVEDEIMAQKSLTRTLTQNFPDLDIVGMTGSVKDTVEWLENNQTDLIFMDVELSDGVCFEIFRQTDVKAKVIMTTAYDSYALKAFEAGSIDYLLKPIDVTDLQRAVGRCRTRENNINIEALMKVLSTQAPQKEYKERYIIKINDRIVPLNVSDIAYIYSEDKNNYLVTTEGQKYIIDSSLDVMNEELDPKTFFRISRSCIISMQSIQSIVKQPGGRLRINAYPAPPYEMTVSRSRVDDFFLWLEK